MNEQLKPCPFCGERSLYEVQLKDYLADTLALFCNSCKALVTWEQVSEGGINLETQMFVREHWNTRAACDNCQMDMKPMTDENMAAAGWVRERTCRNVSEVDYGFKCSICGDWEDIDHPKYCAHCGAKVVE